MSLLRSALRLGSIATTVATMMAATCSLAQQPGNGLPPIGAAPANQLPGGSQPSLSQPSASAFVINNVKGQIKCIFKVPVAAQSDGLIDQLLVEEGRVVKKGDLLAKIDDRLAKAELAVASREAEAAIAQAQNDAELRFAKKAHELADAEYTEWETLLKENAASFQEVRRKKLDAEKAKLSIEVNEVEHNKHILSAEVAKEKVNAAKVQVDLRSVFSPYDAVVVERMRSQGEWVKGGEPIVRIAYLNEMHVEARVELKNIAPFQLKGAPVKVRVKVGSREMSLVSAIEFVSPEIQYDQCRVWAKIPNALVGDAWQLSDGQEAYLDIAPNTAP